MNALINNTFNHTFFQNTLMINSDALVPSPVQYPIYHLTSLSIIPGIDDKALSLLAPFVAYWGLSLFFHLLDSDIFKWPAEYRLHESEEVKKKNLASRKDVVLAVILQQFVQTLMGIVWLDDSESDALRNHTGEMRQLGKWVARLAIAALGEKKGTEILASKGQEVVSWLYWWGIPIAQYIWAMYVFPRLRTANKAICLGRTGWKQALELSYVTHALSASCATLGFIACFCFIIDTWQYFLHRLFHVNKTLYKHVHAVHHRLYVPYAYGALYNHPLEGFLFDTLGAAVAQALSFMTIRQSVVLFAFSTLKTVDDHCGYAIPWDPLQALFGNNADYHDIHHQAIGIKSNFSQPYFIHWDVVLGTRMTREEIDARRQKTKEKALKQQ